MQRVNLDEDRAQAAKYGVRSIPHVVFLDSGGNVLVNATPPQDAESWDQMINQAR